MIFNEGLPIYIQIMDLIKKRLIVGQLKEGDKLPSVRELSSELKVNPNTIQRSYQELEREDLVFTQRGTGTFVTEDMKIIKDLKTRMAANIVKSFIDDMASMGFSLEEVIGLINNRGEAR